MANPTPSPNQVSPAADTPQTSPLRCLLGAVISSGLAYAAYSLTSSIAQTFAAKPVTSTNTIVVNISSAVRTLVVGSCALGTGVFGLVAFGLVALAIQLLIERFTKRPSDT